MVGEPMAWPEFLRFFTTEAESWRRSSVVHHFCCVPIHWQTETVTVTVSQ